MISSGAFSQYPSGKANIDSSHWQQACTQQQWQAGDVLTCISLEPAHPVHDHGVHDHLHRDVDDLHAALHPITHSQP